MLKSVEKHWEWWISEVQHELLYGDFYHNTFYETQYHNSYCHFCREGYIGDIKIPTAEGTFNVITS